MFEDLTERAVALSNLAMAWERLRDIELEENRKMCAELKERRKVEESETCALVEILQVSSGFCVIFELESVVSNLLIWSPYSNVSELNNVKSVLF